VWLDLPPHDGGGTFLTGPTDTLDRIPVHSPLCSRIEPGGSQLLGRISRTGLRHVCTRRSITVVSRFLLADATITLRAGNHVLLSYPVTSRLAVGAYVPDTSQTFWIGVPVGATTGSRALPHSFCLPR